MTELSRRDLFKFGSLAAIGAAGAGALASCAPEGGSGTAAGSSADAGTGEVGTAAGHRREGLPSFLQAPEPITDIAETKDYEIVVVGAGSPGVPCALKAFQDGANVALVTRESAASAFGNTGSGIDLDNSDPVDVANLVSFLMQANQYRPDRKQIEAWAYNSGEAVKWLIDYAQSAGAQVEDQGNAQAAPLIAKQGYNITFVTSFFGPKPYTTGEGMKDILTKAESEGLEVFYSTPAEQLVTDETGRVTGVICTASDGSHIQFNASKGVVVATGDYQSDTEMLQYYQPDMTNFGPKQANRNGDGHKMIVWAGGKIEDIAHTKMLHDFDGGPASMCDMPFLRTKMNGERFCNETFAMSIMNCYLRSAEDQGHYCQVFDSAYMEKGANFPGRLWDPEELKVYMPEEDVERVGVFSDQIRTFKADTLEELAEKLEITDVDTFVQTVADYNAIAEAGADTQFGVPAESLTTIDTPPFYGIHRHVRMSSICGGGVDVNEKQQCLTPEGEVIEGLYAIGNCAGRFYGGIDYPLDVPGLNLGHNYTQGYMVGRDLAAM
ncbi:FAD-binding protein [Slackia heliotrinireducens]|uniref:FAD-binding protein n=1 Tax=Slackia heliotrinireducens TaxID=84110 RepID=UPI003314B05A